MNMNLEDQRWWVVGMAVLLGPDAATALAERGPVDVGQAGDPDRSDAKWGVDRVRLRAFDSGDGDQTGDC